MWRSRGIDGLPERVERSMKDDFSDTDAFDRFRPYLLVLAQQAIPKAIRARVDPSDLVQQTIAEAWRNKHQFRNDKSAGYRPWLRGILTRIAAANVRHHMGTQSRDAKREMAITEVLDRAENGLASIAVASSIGPASTAQHKEDVVALSAALQQLSEDHRNVLFWRHFEDLSHAEIANRLGKSEAAARMLWIRALKSLKNAFAKHTNN